MYTKVRDVEAGKAKKSVAAKGKSKLKKAAGAGGQCHAKLRSTCVENCDPVKGGWTCDPIGPCNTGAGSSQGQDFLLRDVTSLSMGLEVADEGKCALKKAVAAAERRSKGAGGLDEPLPAGNSHGT